MNAVHPVLAFKIECGCIAAIVAMAGIAILAADDTTLFFHKVAEAFSILALVGIILVASPADLLEFLIAFAMTCALAVMLVFPFTLTVADLVICGVRLSFIVLLIYALPRTDALLALRPQVAGILFVAANFGVLLPVPMAMQHWYAAHPYAVLEDVRSFGPTAPLYWGNRREALAGLWAHLSAALVGTGCAFLFVRFGIALYSMPEIRHPDFISLACLLGTVEVVAFINFALFALFVHRRLPTVGRFLATYYSTWRALAAWLSSNPPLCYPTVFQFVRPWSNRALRTAVVVSALAVNSAFTVNWLTAWSVQAYQTTFPGSSELKVPASVVPPSKLEAPRFDTKFWVTLFTAAVFLPPAIIFLMLHAAWGPSFQAFTERFETFDPQATAPLLTFSLGASLRRLLGAVLVIATFIWS
jgi:hypothetical protein